jgi:two-component sensor histidine kinase
VKYGALSVERGRVDLAWSHAPGDETLGLRWAESGGPPVTPPTRRGFGSRLIERALRGELRGAAELTYAPEGLVCAMTARLPKAPETPGPFGDL